MRRGDVVLVRGTGGAVTKARPAVVVQRASSLAGTTKVTVCPMTSELGREPRIRPVVAPDPGTGLRRASQVEVDWIFTERIEYFDDVIGRLDAETMRAVDQALKAWLGL